MGIFGGYRADRLVAEVRDSGDPASAKAKSALAKLQSLGQQAIKPIVDALATADKRETIAFVEALTPLIDNRSFPLLAQALAEENPRAVAGVAWALASSKNYSPSLLLELLSAPGVSKPAVLDVIASQKNRFQLRDLLNAAYQQDPNEKAALFRIAGDLVDPSSVDELVSRVEGKDPIARAHAHHRAARPLRHAEGSRGPAGDPQGPEQAGAVGGAAGHLDRQWPGGSRAGRPAAARP